jgi:peptidoglycan/LPS O-acetylase OafA/YrhL
LGGNSRAGSTPASATCNAVKYRNSTQSLVIPKSSVSVTSPWVSDTVVDCASFCAALTAADVTPVKIRIGYLPIVTSGNVRAVAEPGRCNVPRIGGGSALGYRMRHYSHVADAAVPGAARQSRSSKVVPLAKKGCFQLVFCSDYTGSYSRKTCSGGQGLSLWIIASSFGRDQTAMHRLRTPTISTTADFGRFIGASSIFYYHVGIATRFPFSGWARYATSFFILLSGVAYTCFSSMRPVDLSTYRRYASARVAAIFPTFLTVNAVIFAASYFYASALGRPFTFVEFLLSTLGLSQYFGYRYLSTVMWFFPFVIQAYLLYPIIDKSLKYVSGVLIIVLAFVVSLLLTDVAFSDWPSHAAEICRTWSPIFRLPEICLGLIVGRAIVYRADRRGALAAFATYVVVAFLLDIEAPDQFVGEAFTLGIPWHGLIAAVAVTALAMAASSMSGLPPNTGILRTIRGASLPFFLVHGAATLFIYRRYGTSVSAWLIYFVACWVGAIACSYISAGIGLATKLKSLHKVGASIRPSKQH